MTDAGPLMELLKQQNEPTELDIFFKGTQNNEEVKQESPVVVVDDEDDEDDIPIGLTHRQPSYSSLRGHIVMKGGAELSNLPDLNEEVPEECEEDEDVPIGLTVRHSSYASLSLGQAIPKGHTKPTNATDIIPITEEIPENAVDFSPHKYNPDLEESASESFEEDEEEDSDQNVINVKRLKEKNTKRWKEIGYEPPKNLIPLVRAASQNQLSVSSGHSSENSQTMFKQFCDKLPDPLMDIPEDEADEDPLKDIPKPNPRKRSGSFGMKLGEASSSQALIESIIHENPRTIECDIEEVDDIEEEEMDVINEDEEEELFEEEEEFFYDEEEEDVLELFGRLDQIVIEEPGTPVYETLTNGYLEDENQALSVRKQLKHYIQICQRNLWDAEVEFISGIVARIHITHAAKKQEEAEYYKQEIIDAYENCKKEVADVQKQMETALEIVDKEYMKEANALDEEWQDPKMLSKYNKPSSELNNLRARLRSSFNFLPKREIENLQKEVRKQEAKEVKAKNQLMAKEYHLADRNLKEKYVKKRVTIIRKYERQITTVEAGYDQKIARLKSHLKWSKKGK